MFLSWKQPFLSFTLETNEAKASKMMICWTHPPPPPPMRRTTIGEGIVRLPARSPVGTLRRNE
jgi:hypothetical protein